jgi:hypothetical protein
VAHAFTLQSDHNTGLETWFDANLFVAIKCLDIDHRAKNRVVQRNLERAVQIVTLSAKDFIGTNRDVDIDVAVWATGLTNFALSGKLKAQAVFYSTGDVEVEGSA